jgi:hypothetical protein
MPPMEVNLQSLRGIEFNVDFNRLNKAIPIDTNWRDRNKVSLSNSFNATNLSSSVSKLSNQFSILD